MYKGFYQNRLPFITTTFHYNKEDYTGTGLCLRAFAACQHQSLPQLQSDRMARTLVCSLPGMEFGPKTKFSSKQCEHKYATSGLRFLTVNVLLTCFLHVSSLWSKKKKVKAIGMVEPENRTWEVTSTKSKKATCQSGTPTLDVCEWGISFLHMDHYIYISVSLNKGFSLLYFIHLLIIPGINGECNIICLVLEE